MKDFGIQNMVNKSVQNQSFIIYAFYLGYRTSKAADKS